MFCRPLDLSVNLLLLDLVWIIVVLGALGSCLINTGKQTVSEKSVLSPG